MFRNHTAKTREKIELTFGRFISIKINLLYLRCYGPNTLIISLVDTSKNCEIKVGQKWSVNIGFSLLQLDNKIIYILIFIKAVS